MLGNVILSPAPGGAKDLPHALAPIVFPIDLLPVPKYK
jgi:hypothetical protein